VNLLFKKLLFQCQLVSCKGLLSSLTSSEAPSFSLFVGAGQVPCDLQSPGPFKPRCWAWLWNTVWHQSRAPIQPFQSG